jgi:hypothetical protein
MNWLSIVVTSLGSGVTAFICLLVQQKYARRLEERKVHWNRASWVHQRQVDALAKLYVSLRNMQDNLQGATRSIRMKNEISPEEYMKLAYQNSRSAWSEFIGNKLLVDEDVVAKCDELFKKFLEAQFAFGAAKMFSDICDGKNSAEEWKNAANIAYKHIPALLQDIERSARKIIYEEQGSN